MTAACHDPVNLRTLDKSGNNLHATFGDGATPGTYPTKLATRGYYFNGSMYLNVGLAPLLDFTTTGTIVILFKPLTTPTNFRAIITKQNWITGNNGYSIYMNYPASSTIIMDIRQGILAPNVISTSSPNIDHRQAHFISSRWDTSKLRLYLDGYQTDTPQTVNPTPAGYNFLIGGTNTYNVNGNVYFVGAWNYALTELQLRDLEARLRRQLNDV
jgi:hypothetical protein